MAELSCTHASLHHISLEDSTTSRPDNADTASAFQEYVSRLVEDSNEPTNSRLFRFKSTTVEARSRIDRLIADPSTWLDVTERIAQRLLQVEVATQARYSQLGDLRRGSLLQLRIQSDNRDLLLITKVDHSKNLDEEDLKIHFGLPFRHRTQKSCLVDLKTPETATVSDTNTRISTYWWSDFLELQETRSSATNTKTAYTALEGLLRREVYPKSHGDYQVLRNNLVAYFKTQSDAAYDHLIENVIGDYTPDNDTVDIDSIKFKALSLPERKGFDTSFEIDYDTVKNKTKTKVVLADNLELNLRGPVDNLDRIVLPEKDAQGRKSLRIYSDSGYDEFHKTHSAD